MTQQDRDTLNRFENSLYDVQTKNTEHWDLTSKNINLLSLKVADLETAIKGNGTKGLKQRVNELEDYAIEHSRDHAEKRPSSIQITARRAAEAAVIGAVIAVFQVIASAAGWW